MPDTLLRTKFFIPSLRPNMVPRTRLVERLNQGLDLGHKLTLISAPAGFGKTTLIAEWAASLLHVQSAEKNPQSATVEAKQRNPQLCWLSLDEGDSDLARFLAYLVTALQTVESGMVEKALAMLQAPQPPPADSVLTVLINEITAVSSRPAILLVLDDYHLVISQDLETANPIDEALAFLVDHLPPNMHLVITTREDPNLPLPRLRARGRLSELRAADLRFTPDEAAVFLNQSMGLQLSVEEIAALEARTEGWIAGLQMAALSMQGRTDSAAFIQAFTGSHHFVLDYLIEEVLEQQPKSVQDFLLKTSILDRLNGPLCDAVRFDETPESSSATTVRSDETRESSSTTAVRFEEVSGSSASAAGGQENGRQMLEYLQQANLFITPLDDERRWYRYHHLFADLLRLRLRRQGADSLAELHGRASVWYEENGLEIEAFHHAAAAHDLERAERLVEGGGTPLYYRGAVTPTLHWLESLPTADLDARPSLWLIYAWALWVAHKSSLVEEILQAAEAALQDVEEDEETRNLVGQIAALRAMLAANEYKAEKMIAQSRRALAYLAPGNLPVRTAVIRNLGLAYHFQGDRAAASQAYAEAIAMCEASGNTFTNILATTGLGITQESQTQLYTAVESYKRVLQLAGDPPGPVACAAIAGLARIAYEWNDLDNAQEQGELGVELARQIESIDSFASGELFIVRLKLAQGEIAGAAELLNQVDEAVRRHNFVTQIPNAAAVRVLLLLRQGDLAGAARLAQAHDLPLSQARVTLAQGDAEAAAAVLEPLRQEMEARGWADELLKALILQALTLQAQDREEDALKVLDEALILAEPGGHIRTFIDEGPPMAHLLSEASARGIMPHYTGRLLKEFPTPDIPHPTSHISHPQSAIVDPLTPRELEVLQLIAQGLTNRQISERLFLALSTVKGYNRIIFDKLHVNNRTEAGVRARELGLL